MGSFSFTRADRNTKRANLTYGDKYKILIPKELGGGYIIDIYCDCGDISSSAVYVEPNGKKHKLEGEHDRVGDLYGLLYYFNTGMDDYISIDDKHFSVDKPEREFNHILDIIENGKITEQDIRCRGISMGCYKNQIDYLEYPLKLVSLSYKGSYEDCKGRSYSDPNQGFFAGYWNKEPYRFFKEV